MINPFEYRKTQTSYTRDIWANVIRVDEETINITCKFDSEKVQFERGWIGIFLLNNEYCEILAETDFAGLIAGTYYFKYKIDENDYKTITFVSTGYDALDINQFVLDFRNTLIDLGYNNEIDLVIEDVSPNKLKFISVNRGYYTLYIQPFSNLDTDLLTHIGYSFLLTEIEKHNTTIRATYYEWIEEDVRTAYYAGRTIISSDDVFKIELDITDENIYVGTSRKSLGQYVLVSYLDMSVSPYEPIFKLAECVDIETGEVWIENNKLINLYPYYNVFPYVFIFDNSQLLIDMVEIEQAASETSNEAKLTLERLYSMILYDRKRINVNSKEIASL